ncbi:hypothetical protein KAM448_44450 [Aeromonas caviae]|nr:MULTISPECIES: hypothetical protein [Aeromonas]BCR27772.1 hypothetical protein KAM376_07780 [Aeromonas caviae]GJA83847.1 hypothetical protein KAM355_44070 [Aeromonas caviae]GJB00997.1 hypothetical protein KAM359_44040 [Aeromonas caviae]GJB26695.1 hypothetical protein KAM365_44450 [Aeromonas caviae]GJB43851.1 hypothetical protein KAM369_43260 [Aeromonas caviae]
MSRYSIALALLLGTTLVHAGDMPPPQSPRLGGPMAPPPSVLYHASKQGTDPQALAQALSKNIDAAKPDTRYEVTVSVRELPPQPLKPQPAGAPLKGQ